MNSNEFRRLFEEHSGFVWRVLERHGVPARDLEDACQEVFLVVFRRLGEFEGRSSFRTWLYGIAVRIALGVRRRAYFRRESLTAAPPEASTTGNAIDDVARAEARALLSAALQALPRVKREVFVLYELEGMTVGEAAAALEVPENTALYRLYGARKDVQAFLRREGLLAQVRIKQHSRRVAP